MMSVFFHTWDHMLAIINRTSLTYKLLFTSIAFLCFPFVIQAAPKPTALVVNAGLAVFEMKPEDTRTLTFQFLNTSPYPWRLSGPTPIRFRLKGLGNSFYHSSWITSEIPTRLKEKAVTPRNIGTFTVTLQAPPAFGIYTITPYLIYGSVPVAHDSIELTAFVGYSIPKPESPVLVTPEPAVPMNTPPSGMVAGDVSKPFLDREPDIRVGLFVVEKPVAITSETTITVASGSAVHDTLGAGTVLTLIPEGVSFTYQLPNGTRKTLNEPLRLIAEGGILEVPSLEQRAQWNTALNDNKFRGTLELYYASNTARFWLVNELPFEQYLKGLAETSQGAPPEYHKALAVATRSYALYHWYAKKKHGGHFDVDATYDQVYRGYGVESRLSNFSSAIGATRGIVAAIGEDVAVTPYFSQSDGRTRAWSEVWSGDKAHLTSVPVPWDQGKTLHGHGVGMSSLGAAAMAKEGKTWEEILKYFYTGIELKRAYE